MKESSNAAFISVRHPMLKLAGAAPAPAPVLPPAAPATTPAQEAAKLIEPVERVLESLQGELSALRQEVSTLRGRDETLNFYMHRVDEEMRLAARLQQDFLPKTLPQLGPIFFHTIFRPAGYVSGDLYDVMRLDEKHVGFYMADAVGHGMPAALLTMFMKNALVTKEIIADGYRLLKPSQTMARLNDVLVSQHLSHATFATAIYGLINVETLEMTFARGGHPCPMIMRATGEVESLDTADGSLLGIFENEQFGDCTVKLNPGDRLFLFTDGVEVAFSADNTPDPAQWRTELISRQSMTTDAMLAELVQRLDAEAGSIQPKDDLTIIAVEVKG